MFATAGVQEASSVHDCAISFVILVFLPPFVLCSVVSLHFHFLFYLLVKHPTRILEISFPMFLFSFCLLLLIPTFRYHTVGQALNDVTQS
jgi:energy-coupling factor transporter transmembrane protein EcfT